MQKNNKHTNRPRIDKMVVVMSRSPLREPPKEGDRKMIHGVMHVRRQMQMVEFGQIVSVVSRGRPVYEWVTESEYKKGRGA